MPATVRWFPPSWIQIRSSGAIVYVDPAYLSSNFAKYPKRIEFSRWPDPIDGLPEELEPADLILVTHHHKDHVKRVTVDRLATPDTLVAAPKGCVKELGDGFRVLRPGDSLEVKGVGVKAVDAYNTPEGSSTQKVHHRGECVGYLLNVDGGTVYHAGDTDLIPEMAELGEVDVAFLPIGGTYTMDAEEAVAAALLVRPKVAVPMHYREADPEEFSRAVLAGSDEVRPVILGIGDSVLADGSAGGLPAGMEAR